MADIGRFSAAARNLPSEYAEDYASLVELALDLRWSWNHSADELFRQLDPHLWNSTRNPWAILQTVSRATLQKALADDQFHSLLEDLKKARHEALASPGWFQQYHAAANLSSVAYFSMEFMLSEALPIYSGGLGNVAGDQLKAASDLGVPVVGVGLLYQQGYFRQAIDKEGNQQALFPYNDPGNLPITPIRDDDGQWLRLEVRLPGLSIWLRTWQAQVGRCKLYLLDSNDPGNHPTHRGITSELYGGGQAVRLRQEMILGIAGTRLLRAVGLNPEVCHLNEGHAALAVLERARNFMEETGEPFDVALAATRCGNVFTTHTAVPAGFDWFPPNLVEDHLGRYAQLLGISMHDLLGLGRANPSNTAEYFNMAYLAIRGSGAVNAVSRLHGQVSRRLFAPLFPRWPLREVPVAHVTNGIHVPSWDSAAADDLWTRRCGQARWLGTMETLGQSITGATDAEIWSLRAASRKDLVEFIRPRLAQELALSGASARDLESAQHVFDRSVLTLGFARRFASYKRPNLLLTDRERLFRLLTNPGRPVQLIVAGKAHPLDPRGMSMVRDWIDFARRPEVRCHVVFLSDYDMLLAEQIVQGVDVWINTPQRPWEACGTSGMKVLVNGGLNVSELDGWWAEAYAPELGWAVGDTREHTDDPKLDREEAILLYELLEREVIPAFYERDADGIPKGWIARVRASMARLTPQFSAARAVQQYTDEYYLPGADRYRRRSANHGAAAAHIVQWHRHLREQWQQLRFELVNVTTNEGQHNFEATVYSNALDRNWFRVELYADATADKPAIIRRADRDTAAVTPDGRAVYRAHVPISRPASDFTFRIVPEGVDIAVPLEAPQIMWQH